MKIGFDAKRLFSNYTGLGNYSRTLVENLCSYYPEHHYALFTPKTKENQRTAFFFKQENVQLITPRVKNPLWRSFGIQQQIKQEEIAVFHGLSAELPFGLTCPSVVTIHDLIFETHPQQYSKIDQNIYSYKAKRACKEATKIVAISETTKQDIIRFYGIGEQKIEVIYQSCDDSFHQSIPAQEIARVKQSHQLPDRYLLYVGSVIERKGLLKIVQAIHQMNGKHTPPLVVIGGRNSAYGKQVEKYIQEHQLADQILLQNDLPFSDFPAIYKGAEMMIYPSEYEGFGIPVIEAQAVGTPVITSRLSCLPESGGPHSYLLEEITPASIQEAIEILLTDEQRVQEMKVSGVEYIQKFDREKNTRQLMELYQTIV